MYQRSRSAAERAAALSGNPAELRAAPRHALLIRSAKLIVNGAEYVCVLRDASETGVSLRLFHGLATSRFMLLELQDEEQHEVELVWHDGERLGLRFCERVDVHRLIQTPAPTDRRPLRVRLDIPAMIGAGLDDTLGKLNDLSQQGAKVECDRMFAIEQRVRLTASGMPKVQAKVRWRRENMVGLAFETTFQLGELAAIVARIHQSAPAPNTIQPGSILESGTSGATRFAERIRPGGNPAPDR